MRNIKFNKIFGIYSIVLPLILICLWFFIGKFGTMSGDGSISPYGQISDFISFTVALIICPILFILNIVLFCNTVKITKSNTVLSILMLVSNIILSIQFILTVWNVWFLISTFLFVEPIYLIIWLIYLIYFIINYKKITKETNSE